MSVVLCARIDQRVHHLDPMSGPESIQRADHCSSDFPLQKSSIPASSQPFISVNGISRRSLRDEPGEPPISRTTFVKTLSREGSVNARQESVGV